MVTSLYKLLQSQPTCVWKCKVMCFVGQFVQNLLELSKEKLKLSQFNGRVNLQTTFCHTVTKQKIKKGVVPNKCPGLMDHRCERAIPSPRNSNVTSINLNLLQTKGNLLYIRNLSVPRSKHFPPRL